MFGLWVLNLRQAVDWIFLAITWRCVLRISVVGTKLSLLWVNVIGLRFPAPWTLLAPAAICAAGFGIFDLRARPSWFLPVFVRCCPPWSFSFAAKSRALGLSDVSPGSFAFGLAYVVPKPRANRFCGVCPWFLASGLFAVSAFHGTTWLHHFSDRQRLFWLVLVGAKFHDTGTYVLCDVLCTHSFAFANPRFRTAWTPNVASQLRMVRLPAASSGPFADGLSNVTPFFDSGWFSSVCFRLCEIWVISSFIGLFAHGFGVASPKPHVNGVGTFGSWPFEAGLLAIFTRSCEPGPCTVGLWFGTYWLFPQPIRDWRNHPWLLIVSPQLCTSRFCLAASGPLAFRTIHPVTKLRVYRFSFAGL